MATFAQWTERLKVHNDYIKAMGEYSKALADAALRQAETAERWERVRAMRIVISELEKAFTELRREQNQTAREIDRIKQHEVRALFLLRGRPIDVFNEAWRSYQWFESRALLESGDGLYELTVTAEARPPDNFISNRSPRTLCDPLPDTEKNVLELADWLMTHKYMTARGKPAQQLLVRLFDKINDVAHRTIDALREQIQKIEDRTFDFWKPPSIIGVPASRAAKQIETAAQKIPKDS